MGFRQNKGSKEEGIKLHWEEIAKQEVEWFYSRFLDSRGLLSNNSDITKYRPYFPPRFDIFLNFIGKNKEAKILDVGGGLATL